jgi:hypothetical protein
VSYEAHLQPKAGFQILLATSEWNAWTPDLGGHLELDVREGARKGLHSALVTRLIETHCVVERRGPFNVWPQSA